MSLTRRKFFWLLGGTAISGSAAHWRTGVFESAKAHGLQEWVRTQSALGTQVTLKVLHSDAVQAQSALQAAFESIDHVEEVMSLYRPQSQISRLNRDGLLRDPDPDLLTVLTAAEDLARRSDGAFDITVQPLWSLFSKAARWGREPALSEVETARSRINWKSVEITSNLVRLRGDRTQITLNGIAQGFALDRVQSILLQHGIQHALIDTGEIAGLGNKNGTESWRVGIQNPREPASYSPAPYSTVIDLDGRCLATSGDYSTVFRPDRVNHHIFDPRTGRSPTELASVSVVAPMGLWADGLSTAMCVLGIEAGSRLLSTIPRTGALFVKKNGEMFTTPGFPAAETLISAT